MEEGDGAAVGVRGQVDLADEFAGRLVERAQRRGLDAPVVTARARCRRLLVDGTEGERPAGGHEQEGLRRHDVAAGAGAQGRQVEPGKRRMAARAVAQGRGPCDLAAVHVVGRDPGVGRLDQGQVAWAPDIAVDAADIVEG